MSFSNFSSDNKEVQNPIVYNFPSLLQLKCLLATDFIYISQFP